MNPDPKVAEFIGFMTNLDEACTRIMAEHQKVYWGLAKLLGLLCLPDWREFFLDMADESDVLPTLVRFFVEVDEVEQVFRSLTLHPPQPGTSEDADHA